ncbi:MAG TPA: hypothetical protein VGN31_15875 [Paraburkholderia sp.]|jgi:hypothetical protein
MGLVVLLEVMKILEAWERTPWIKPGDETSAPIGITQVVGFSEQTAASKP